MYNQPTLDGLLANFQLDPLAWSLQHTTFVVLDLETTGGAPDGGGITEVGAVKVRGGERLGVLATLVNPGMPVPPMITLLTGITTAMVLPAPPIEHVLPSILEFLQGAVLVAHNAPYDVGFLKAACAVHGYQWPAPRVLDTAALARRVLIRDEVPNRKLGTLAAYFRTPHQPSHRALADAEATVDVLHALIARLSGFRVHTLGDTLEFAKPITPVQRTKRHLAVGLPHVPGVYVFRAADERPLYVGTSGDIATRVRTYFTAAERRARISEMLNAAVRVEALECAHALEAQVRELRLIAAHAPPYNKRSKFPERVQWLRLISKPTPKLGLTRKLPDAPHLFLGPFSGSRTARTAADAIEQALPPGEWPLAFGDDPEPVINPLLARIERLAAAQRYEDAAKVRERLAVYLRATIRMQRLTAITSLSQVIAAARNSDGGWEIAIVRYGRLAAAATSAPSVHPRQTLEQIRPSAETVLPGAGPTPGATAEETERILDWLERPQTRLVELSSGWESPARGAGAWRDLLSRIDVARSTIT